MREMINIPPRVLKQADELTQTIRGATHHCIVAGRALDQLFKPMLCAERFLS